MTRSRTRRTRKQTRIRLVAGIAAVAAIMATTAAGCGSSNGVVGGECANAYTQCGLACFDLQTDPNNCGACGNVCLPGVACVSGTCANELADGGEDAPFNWDGAIYEDGQYCDFNPTDPAHPICRPGPDSSDVETPNDGTTDQGPPGDGSNDGANEANPGDGAPVDGSGDTSLGDGAPLDGSVDGSQDGSFPDSSLDASFDANFDSNFDACSNPPYDTPAACGACGITCYGLTPICSLEDGGYQCVPMCTAPLTQCEGRCVNLSRDPNNCGKCGNVCASEYCYLATCQGTTAGAIIVLGHDFSTASQSDEEAKLLLNAVFFNETTVRLLSYEHYVNTTAVAHAKAILTANAGANITITPTVSDTYITTTLANKTTDVVMIWDQPLAPSGTLGTLGTTWGPALSEFTQGGGVVVVLDTATGVAQMPALETNAALLNVTGHAVVTAGSVAAVLLNGEGLVRGMTSLYGVELNTAWFSTSETVSATTVFAVTVQGQPTQLLAVQKIVN